jgi:hypothetical protein
VDNFTYNETVIGAQNPTLDENHFKISDLVISLKMRFDIDFNNYLNEIQSQMREMKFHLI